MAHKTRSKEQFESRFYRFLIRVKLKSAGDLAACGVLNSLLLILLFKKELLKFETNTVFLKTCFFRAVARDARFFSYGVAAIAE